MTATRKPRPVAAQAGRRSKDLALDNQPTGTIHRAPALTGKSVRERARVRLAQKSVRLGARQIIRSVQLLTKDVQRAGLCPEVVARLATLEAAAADFAAVVRRPETWTEAEQ